MFEDFSSQEEQISEQKENRFNPLEENIIKEIGVPVDLPPESRAEVIAADILELPPELQVPAIEMVVEDAAEVKADSAIVSILRNIIKTELGRGLEQDLKDKIVDLAYEIGDIDLQKTLLVELEKAGILVRKYEGPTDTRRAEVTKKVVPVEEVVETEEEIVDELDEAADEVKQADDEEVEVVEQIEVRKFDFAGEHPPEDWELGGGAKVTGDGKIDEIGKGYLRLTENTAYDMGYALYDQALSTEKGLAFSFNYVSWGGNGADGITFFLVDGKTTSEEFSPGGVGGSLGYAPRHKVDEGMTNAYLGVGLDEFGNFSAPTEGRTGGPGRTADAVTIRAGGDGFDGYDYVAGTGKLAQGIDKTGVKERPESEVRKVTISLDKTENQTMSLTMDMQFGEGGKTERLFEGVEIPGEVPETVKFGFVATTGGSTNYHEVREVTAQEASMEEPIIEVAEQKPEKIEPIKAVAEQPSEIKVEQKPEKTDASPPSVDKAG
jgi:hypothetical protein